MKSKYDIKLNVNSLYNSDYLDQILSNLEKLDNIKNAIFASINNGIAERAAKLSNLKSRINRIKQIIAMYNNISQAMTIKSKKNYPTEEYLFYKSLFNQDLNRIIEQERLLNINRLVNIPGQRVLGFPPKGSIDDGIDTQKILNTLPKFKDIPIIMNEKSKNFNVNIFEDDVENDILESDLKYTNSEFSFLEKKKMKSAINPKASLRKGTSDTGGANNSFIQTSTKKKEKKKEVLQEAPVSIKEKTKISEFTTKKNFLPRTQSPPKFEVNLPSNINLGNIAQISNDLNTAPIDEYFQQDEPEQNERNTLGEALEEDNKELGEIEDYDQMPLDWVEHRHLTVANNQVQQPTQDNNNTTTTVSTNPQPVSQPTTVSTNPQPVSQPTTSSVPMQPVQQSGSIPVPPPLIVNPPKPINPPKAEPPKPAPKKEEPKKEEPKKEEPKKEEPKEEEKVEEEKKDEEPKEEEKKDEDRPLTMEEELARSMKNLKKVNEIKVEESVNKKEEKKENGGGLNMMDLLKQQIKYRFQKLHEHDDDDDEEEESESSI